jgi:RHS repeat-associated protein
VTKTHTYSRQRISENQLSGSTWTPTFYGYDGHGNVRFTTSTAGAVGNTYQFDAFGAPIASTGTIANTYLYSGERFDSNLNLYHLRARFYNMLTGRFTTMDPMAENVLDPGALHKYVYTKNNPVNAVDPTGKSLEEEGEIDEISLKAERTVKRLGVEEDCVDEWAEAYLMCAAWLSSPNPSLFSTGGYNNIADCARGLVSQRCGGNPVVW